MVKKIYGMRTCPSCRGIVHKGAYRSKIGQRKQYFCSINCVERNVEKQLKKYLKYPKEKTIKDATKDRMKYLERIDVITR